MIAVKNSKESSSSLAKTATDALALMNTKASRGCKTPSFYTQLVFLTSFAKSFFTNAFDVAMQCDPQYGRTSFGYISCLYVERCFVMKKQLMDLAEELSPNSWKSRVEYKRYQTAIADIPKLGKVAL